jgi:hypothetical protein
VIGLTLPPLTSKSTRPTNFIILASCQDSSPAATRSLISHKARSPLFHSHVRRLVHPLSARVIHSPFDKNSFIVYRPSTSANLCSPSISSSFFHTFRIFCSANTANHHRRLLPPRCKSQTSFFSLLFSFPGPVWARKAADPFPSIRSLDRWLSFANKVLPGLVAAPKSEHLS